MTDIMGAMLIGAGLGLIALALVMRTRVYVEEERKDE